MFYAKQRKWLCSDKAHHHNRLKQNVLHCVVTLNGDFHTIPQVTQMDMQQIRLSTELNTQYEVIAFYKVMFLFNFPVLNSSARTFLIMINLYCSCLIRCCSLHCAMFYWHLHMPSCTHIVCTLKSYILDRHRTD